MTFHRLETVKTLLHGFVLEHFQEVDEAGQALSGPKHWHVFNVIARKVG
jgi:hypothetical protein